MATIIKTNKDLQTDSPYKFENLTPTPPKLETVNTTPIQNNGVFGTPKVEVPSSLSTSQLSKTVAQPKIVDNSGLIKNIQTTYDKYTAEAGANEDFIKGAIKASGQVETPELLAQYKGKKLGDVISGLGLGEKVGYTATPSPTIVPEANKGTSGKINPSTGEIINPTAEDVANYNAKYETVSQSDKVLDELENMKVGASDEELYNQSVYGQRANKIKGELDLMKADLEMNKIFNLQTSQELGKLARETKGEYGKFEKSLNEAGAETARNKGIILGDKASEINAKLDEITGRAEDWQDATAMKDAINAYKYNVKLVEYSVAQGDYETAREIAKETAETNDKIFNRRIDILLLKGQIDDRTANALKDQSTRETNYFKDGYLPLSADKIEEAKNDIATGKKKGFVWTDPVTQKTYLVPESEKNNGKLVTINGTSYIQNADGTFSKPNVPTSEGSEEQLYSGLSSPTATAVRSKVSSFKSEPVVANYNVVNEGYNFVKSLSSDTNNPADDQAFIYSFAKIMDPNSVVREGEYATVQKYAQSWADTFGFDVKRIFSNEKFLTKEAIDNMKATLLSKYQASEKNYNNVYKQYTDNINNLTGRNDGEKFLVDYSQAFKEKMTPEDYVLSHPDQAENIRKMIEEGKTDEEIGQIYGFIEVDGDTNEAVKISQAIGQFESGGNYKAIGPKTSSGDQAYGKYQIMGNNIPSWSKEALGYSITKEEFLSSPELQDKIAQYKMGKYFDKYGNIEDVASMWFSGKPAAKAGNAKDVIGTSVPKYISSVRSIYNKLS